MLEPERILRLEEDAVVLLDQRLLPLDEVEVRCESVGALADAIEKMVVRGAPAIGVAAAYGIALAAAQGENLVDADRVLRASRPTAVNLAWALDEMRDDPSYQHARRIHADEVERCRRMAAHAADLLAPGTRALTHCNAGGLATGGFGSAVGALLTAWERGLLERRMGRRDAPTPAGRPAHCLGARSRLDPACGDRRLRCGLADGGRRGGLRDHGRGPDRRER